MRREERARGLLEVLLGRVAERVPVGDGGFAGGELSSMESGTRAYREVREDKARTLGEKPGVWYDLLNS